MKNIIAAILIMVATAGFVVSQISDTYAQKPTQYYASTCVMPDTSYTYCSSGGSISCSGSTTCG